MLIWSNAANGKTSKDTHATNYAMIQDFELLTVPDGVEVWAILISGQMVLLITEPSYDKAIARVRAIRDTFAFVVEDKAEYDLRFLQLHPG